MVSRPYSRPTLLFCASFIMTSLLWAISYWYLKGHLLWNTLFFQVPGFWLQNSSIQSCPFCRALLKSAIWKSKPIVTSWFSTLALPVKGWMAHHHWMESHRQHVQIKTQCIDIEERNGNIKPGTMSALWLFCLQKIEGLIWSPTRNSWIIF